MEEIKNTVFDEETYKQMERDGLSKETIDAIKQMTPEEMEVHENEENYKSVFTEYNLSDSDVEQLIKVVNEYKSTKEHKGLYAKLPNAAKYLADGMISMSIGLPGPKMTKDRAAEELLKSFINDAKFDNAMSQYSSDISELMTSSNKDFQELINGSINEVFEKIDQLEKTNPDRAEEIRGIKKAFDEANKLILGFNSKKKIDKLYKRYKYEFTCFEKKFEGNPFNINMPKLGELIECVRRGIKNDNRTAIIKFLLNVLLNLYSKQPDNIIDVAYTYRLLANLQMIEYTDDEEYKDKISDYVKIFVD